MSSETAPAPTEKDITPAVTQAIEASAEEVGFKVFVGNLSFSTKEGELRELFGKFGEITEAQIIHRGPRSLGYGFVTFKSQDSATASISALDKNTIKDRQINVEMAKPSKVKDLGEAVAEKVGGEEAVESGEGGEVKEGKGRYLGRRGRGRGRGFRGRGRGRGKARSEGASPPNEEVKVEEQPAEPTVTEDTTAAKKPTRGRGRGFRGRGRGRGGKRPSGTKSEGEEDGEVKEGETAKEGEEPKKRFFRRVKGPPTGEPSKTMLFVANLSFSIDDEKLKAIFTSATPPYTVVSAHVVTRRPPSKNTGAIGRSKGFGFVELGSEEEQKRALAELDGKSFGETGSERPIQVKVAIEGQKEEAQTEGEKVNGAKVDNEAEAWK